MKLATLRRYALSLPEVTEQPHFAYTSFRVRGRIFLTVPPEASHAHVFLGPIARKEALAQHPELVSNLLWGGKVVGLRVDLAGTPAALAKHLVRRAWMAKAPATLVAKGGQTGRSSTAAAAGRKRGPAPVRGSRTRSTGG